VYYHYQDLLLNAAAQEHDYDAFSTHIDVPWEKMI
jgi:hypothetical protein